MSKVSQRCVRRMGEMCSFGHGSPCVRSLTYVKVALMPHIPLGDELTSGQASMILRVNARTVNRWGDDGVLPMERTAAGHRRFKRPDVLALRDLRAERAAELAS